MTDPRALTGEHKVVLRRRLRERHPWVADPDVGPSAVEAGDCDACGLEARLVTTCGPGPVSLGRRCAQARGAGAWCDGHADEAAAALRRLSALPAEADDVARLWWVACGEVAVDPALLGRARRRDPELSAGLKLPGMPADEQGT